jgi:hypothetical protein
VEIANEPVLTWQLLPDNDPAGVYYGLGVLIGTATVTAGGGLFASGTSTMAGPASLSGYPTLTQAGSAALTAIGGVYAVPFEADNTEPPDSAPAPRFRNGVAYVMGNAWMGPTASASYLITGPTLTATATITTPLYSTSISAGTATLGGTATVTAVGTV